MRWLVSRWITRFINGESSVAVTRGNDCDSSLTGRIHSPRRDLKLDNYPRGAPYPPREIMKRYVRNAVLLQRIRIHYSLLRKERTREQWRQALLPCFSYDGHILWRTHASITKAKWMASSTTAAMRVDEAIKGIEAMGIDDGVKAVSCEPQS